MYVWQHTIVDGEGLVVVGARVEVVDADTLEAVPIYADIGGEVPLSNPVEAGDDGFVRFYAAAGHYNITATSDALECIWEDVQLGFTLADMPDLTATLTPIIEAAIEPAIEAIQDTLDATPETVWFTVNADGSSDDAPVNVNTTRLGQGVYDVAFSGIGFLEYNVKLTVWDPSSDRLYSAMLESKEGGGFTYTVRSIHDEASNSDSRVDVEISYVGTDALFPYTFIAVNTNGKVETSQDGLTWTSGGFIEGSSQAREWAPGCYHSGLNRVYTCARNPLTSPNRIRLAYMDETGAFTMTTPSIPGLGGGAVNMTYDARFGTVGRLYVNYRQSGGTEGGVIYSDDGGATWAEVTWTDGKSTAMWDIECLFLTPTGVVCLGRCGSDTNSQRTVLVSTDGLSFTITLSGVSGGIQLQDGQGRPGVYSPTHDLCFVFGCSQSSFNPPQFWTMNAAATAVNTAPANMTGAGNNADSFAGFATATCVLAGYTAGSGTNTLMRRAGATFVAQQPAGASYVSRQFAQSEALGGRIVAATNSNAFIVSDDDGVTWAAVAPSGIDTGFRVMVATR